MQGQPLSVTQMQSLNATSGMMATNVAVVDEPEGLSALFEPSCAAAIWRRNPLPAFQTWIDGLSPDHLPDGRVILHPSDVEDIACEICDIAETPKTLERDLLVQDVTALAHIFTGLMKARYLRLRLDVVDTNACHKFHIDAITARLICTYRGPGTQYGVSLDGNDPDPILSVPTGSPILLQGNAWANKPSSALRHRSPPIADTGETRLVLVIDEVFDPEEEI